MKQKAKILLVEDDYSILDGMADLLQLFSLDYDIQVLKATDGAEGLAMLRQEVPDLIISDIMMPRMNGFQFLEEVRANPDWVHIPFIFLTAKGKEEDILQGRRSGAELYITKPFVSEELLELVKTQLDRTFRLKEVREQKLDTFKRNILQLLNHEFRTPLTYVTAYYEMLSDSVARFEDTGQLQEYLRGIQVGSRRLTSLINDLITIMEIRTGTAASTFEREAQPINDIGHLLQRWAEAHRPLASKAKVSLHYHIPKDLPHVYGVPGQLKDAFHCLLDNAIKFTRPATTGRREVIVEAKRREEHICLAVSDTGVGVPSHAHDQLFDLFYQHNREMLEQQGSGAGLAIARGLVQLHGGTIEVESEVDNGSKFTIVLPIFDPEEESAMPEQETRRATILIVEDDRHLLAGLKELLEFSTERYILSVLTAENGQRGLEVLEMQQPDLIISDIMMPIMDGYEFLRQVRENPAWVQIPVIFLTAKGEREEIHRGRRSGVEEYITKPYDIDELLDLTYTQLDRHFQRQGAISQDFEGLKRSILGMLQPDFQAPLHLVTSYSQKLASGLENVETDEDLISSLQVIQAGSERLTRLVEDFIAMAEFKTGEASAAFELQATPVEPVSLILYEAAYQKELSDSVTGVSFRYDLDHNLPPVLCDTARLSSGFRRLIEILVELCDRENGCILELGSSSDGETVSLSFQLVGTTLPDAIAGPISSFFEEPQEEILEVPTFGPGLTVVRNIILLHEGSISLENNAVNGTRLRIMFPAYRPTD